MKLTLNREFLNRHLFALTVFLLLSGWFGYDAFVRYPAVSAHDLYVSIEKSEPAAGTDLAAFKAQKVSTQRVFTALTFLVGAAVGLQLLLLARFAFSFDEDGFTCAGVKRPYSAIETVDTTAWERKGILVISGKKWKIKLDSWHHTGVKDFYEKIQKRG